MGERGIERERVRVSEWVWEMESMCVGIREKERDYKMASKNSWQEAKRN